MTRHLIPGEPPVEITLRRSARARRFSLRVSRLDGRVTLSMPARAPETEALRFAAEKAGWLRTVVAAAVPRAGVGFGATVPFEGRAFVLGPAAVRAVRIEGEAMLAPPDPARLGARVEAFLKFAARRRLQAACETHAAAVGRRFARITLRDVRSRWGSCTADGGLMFSWRLIMAPPEVLDYVSAHEVAHLVEMNHSDAFWTVVERLMPGYRPHRRWLKQHGAGLHRLDFGAGLADD